MKSIEVAVLNPEVIPSAEKMMVCAARLTQRGHKIKSLDDFMALYNKSYTEDTVTTMIKLPHPTIQKFGAINVVIVGASRRFLAQITRHQNEVKFMSASLQYSDYSDDAAFAIPYEVMARGEEETYLTSCKLNMANYAEAVRQGLDNDAAGYMAPQGLRNVLLISATPYQWKHIIGQRTCRRNTSETRLVLLKVWDELYKLLQLAGGAVYDENGKAQIVHDQKLEVLDQLIEEANGQPVLVFYNYKHELDRLQARYPQAVHVKEENVVKRWNAKEIPILLANPASAGHGLNLQFGGHIAIWYSPTWNLEFFQQANKRLHRRGQTEPVLIHTLAAKGTIDERIYDIVLRNKEAGQNALLEAVKARIKEVT